MTTRYFIYSISLLLLLMSTITVAINSSHAQNNTPTIDDLSDQDLLSVFIWMEGEDIIDQSIERIDRRWKDEYTVMLLENLQYSPSRYMRTKIVNLLRKKTGENYRNRINDWYHWLWNQPQAITEDYANFKAYIYKNLDPKFEAYFHDRQKSAAIRLDEIRWGGVQQDGIPPLRNPEMVDADDATYLEDDNVIFGIEVNGDARAYPKRILAWHEMFTDVIGGENIAGVYCTLCGTVIPYKTELNGKNYTLGTSGFLYRSNKLMYDAGTQSLWNTILGEPVLGPLAGQGIQLDYVGVVTTTWEEWRTRHPDTKVLSLDTGFERDYDEGEAYKDYFDDDNLLFSTPFMDARLDNKQEILALRFAASPSEQLAIDTEFLDKNSLYTAEVGLQKLLILTDNSGASRVYNPGDLKFTQYDRKNTVVDINGLVWSLSESALTNPDGRRLERLPAHRAFWFGWHAAFPETRLIQ